jgi:hypothetical protein
MAKAKCTVKPREGESTPKHKKKLYVLYEYRPSEEWFLSYSLLTIKEDVQLVHLELQRRTFYV